MYALTFRYQSGGLVTDSSQLVERVLSKLSGARVAVVGDFCVDHYLFVTEGAADTSVETGLHTRRVGEVRVAPGGAGNVVNNLGALGVGAVEAFGVIGDDMYGRELTRLLQNAGAATSGLVVQETGWSTSVYTKVYEDGEEDPRLDIGARNHLSEDTAQAIYAALREALPRVDVIIVNQQIREALFEDSFRRELVQLLAAAPEVERIVDSRDYADAFHETVRKINLAEARYFGGTREVDEPDCGASAAEIEDLCRSLSLRWGTPIVVTRGEDGCVVADAERIDTIPGVAMPRPVDPVGAGDALLAGMAAARAAGIGRADAAAFGNLCAAVSVKKLYQTGTASPDELRGVARRPAYRMRPDLARALERAQKLGTSRIEVVTSPPDGRSLRYAIFDHDGTISVLREGWEPVMQDVMVRAVLGDSMSRAEAGASGTGPGAEIERAVSELISDTTGVQTIEQMHALRELVRSYGYVAEEAILSAEEYKRVYLEALHRMIDRRLQLVRDGVLQAEDVTVKSAVAALEALRGRNVTLFLASGSDHDAVVEEAELLGYAELFDGGIFGSVGDAERDPKTVVLEQILNTIGDESAEAVVTFGDGPVEIRETVRRGGTAVGVASDEVRRHGLNPAKRTRLILAGADLVIPDFAELDELLAALFGGR